MDMSYFFFLVGPLIMRIGNDEIDRTQVLTTCSWFLMNKIENGMEKHGKHKKNQSHKRQFFWTHLNSDILLHLPLINSTFWFWRPMQRCMNYNVS